MNIKDLQQEEARISEAIATLRSELAEIGGERYQGCWLDSTQDRTGKKSYTRLRWFINVAAKKKGCRTLKGDEIATATKAIELWAALGQHEAELARLSDEMRRAEDERAIVEALARSLGWTPPQPKKPARKSGGKRGDRHTSPSGKTAADVQTVPDGTRVKVPAGWNAEIIGYEGNGRYQVRFLDGITGATDTYPRFMLEVS